MCDNPEEAKRRGKEAYPKGSRAGQEYLVLTNDFSLKGLPSKKIESLKNNESLKKEFISLFKDPSVGYYFKDEYREIAKNEEKQILAMSKQGFEEGRQKLKGFDNRLKARKNEVVQSFIARFHEELSAPEGEEVELSWIVYPTGEIEIQTISGEYWGKYEWIIGDILDLIYQ